MKRLIGDKKQELLENLLESISIDKNGNLTVGKNLEVDGKAILNTASDLETKDGTGFGGTPPALIRHTVTITYGGESYQLCFTDYNLNNNPINSIQDLTAQFGNTYVNVSGAIKTAQTASEEIASKLYIGTSAADTVVTNQVGNEHKLSDLAQYSQTESYLLIEDHPTKVQQNVAKKTAAKRKETK